MGLRGLASLLAGSAFLADVDARDRHGWRVAGSVTFGLAAGLAASVVCTVILLVIYGLAAAAPGKGAEGVGAALSDLMGGEVTSVERAAFIMLVPVVSNGAL